VSGIGGTGASDIQSRSFGVSFVVIAATYGVSLDVSGTHTFPEAIFGYPAQTAKEVTITNTGNRPTGGLTVSAGTDFEVTTPENGAVSSIPAGETAAFSVRPKTGLAVGTHTATVTVSGSANIQSRSFSVSFEVTALTVTALAARMAEDKNSPSATYTLPGGAQTWTDGLTLTAANSPASVTIDGGGSVVTGSANSVTGSLNRITVGAGVSLTLTNVTFDTLPLTVEAGGNLVLETGAVIGGIDWPEQLVNDIAVGAMAVSVSGTLVMKPGALVTDNRVPGVVLWEDNSVFMMEGGEISHNGVGGLGDWGGGVVLNGAGSSFTMSGGLISDNTDYVGAGVLVFGENCEFTMTDGEISGNEASHGGGVMVWPDSSVFNMEGGVIKNNRAIDIGGGAFIYKGSFHMTGGEITGNTAVNNGGGVGGAITGSPQIGGTTAPASGGWIHGNTKPNGTPSDVN
jgi:hypothetical protein